MSFISRIFSKNQHSADKQYKTVDFLIRTSIKKNAEVLKRLAEYDKQAKQKDPVS